MYYILHQYVEGKSRNGNLSFAYTTSRFVQSSAIYVMRTHTSRPPLIARPSNLRIACIIIMADRRLYMTMHRDVQCIYGGRGRVCGEMSCGGERGEENYTCGGVYHMCVLVLQKSSGVGGDVRFVLQQQPSIVLLESSGRKKLLLYLVSPLV